jgi:hypothetical protein
MRLFNSIGFLSKIIESFYLNNKDIIEIIEYQCAKVWYKNNLIHRDNDLPAIEFFDGDKEYWEDQKMHRIKGPAIEYKSSNCFAWFYEGKVIDCSSQEEFERILKLRLFL